jgi:hypothetical protein
MTSFISLSPPRNIIINCPDHNNIIIYFQKHNETRGVSHCGLAILHLKVFKAEEELWKLKYFTMQKYILQEILAKKPKSFKIL